ncbi:hypothetical protein [Halomonas sp. BC04]|uniref:hypothetical protein n=1 Tax=Halomonas sp. BC04 TaxID=1403540 RepID=UPI0003ED73B0|nr:hypothetical protein [Halomonas sp. BC04]EWG99232.1 hypothetical protein Q427_26135 [Halomonas sp. BC04]
MNTATQQTQPFEAEVLQFWASQAQLQRAAFDALADYLTTLTPPPWLPLRLLPAATPTSAMA